MSNFDSLGDRMKRYENVPKLFLMTRTPVIVRIDGKAFHSFARGFKKPFDEKLQSAMWSTAAALCAEVSGCKLAYVQSDEISLLLTDYKTLTTEGYFKYNLEKLVSITASIATCTFNKEWERIVAEETQEMITIYGPNDYRGKDSIYERHLRGLSGAMFDSRAFNLPFEEVCNYFIWRQQDWSRNSIEMLGRTYFSDKELYKKNNSMIQDMLMETYNVNWNDLSSPDKRGVCVTREKFIKGDTIRSRWVPNLEIPIFTQDREYIEKFVYLRDEEETNNDAR